MKTRTHQNHLLGKLTTICLFTFLLILQPLAYGAKGKTSEKITPLELQSQLMSFADRFMGGVNATTMNYLLNNPNVTTIQRTLVEGRKLEAISAAVRIAAGINPEVSLLDMIVLVSLLKYSTEVDIIPKILGEEAKILLIAYENLEKDIWSIASNALSKEQEKELHKLIEQWKKEHKLTFGVAYYRFSDFAKNRRLSTLVSDKKSGRFLAKISDATKEVEQTRVLAERTLFMAERQPTLLRWQVEQIFFELAITPEFKGLLNSSVDISKASQRLAAALETMSKSVSTESGAIIQVFM